MAGYGRMEGLKKGRIWENGRIKEG